ncbi:MAG: 4-hydroxy-tetrahydrodipicolinate reductase, partial [Oscillospiraceae bacterium]
IELINFAIKRKVPILIGTTGFDSEQLAFIKKSSEKIPIFLSANMSIGANLLTKLSVYTAAEIHNISDIDIIEKHHKYKLDTPSGTALMIENAIELSLDQPCDITIHSVRSGGIYGEHQVLFASKDEIITITHTALSRTAFVRGAIEYANFICTKKTGLFSSLNTYTKIK